MFPFISFCSLVACATSCMSLCTVHWSLLRLQLLYHISSQTRTQTRAIRTFLVVTRYYSVHLCTFFSSTRPSLLLLSSPLSASSIGRTRPASILRAESSFPPTRVSPSPPNVSCRTCRVCQCLASASASRLAPHHTAPLLSTCISVQSCVCVFCLLLPLVMREASLAALQYSSYTSTLFLSRVVRVLINKRLHCRFSNLLTVDLARHATAL